MCSLSNSWQSWSSDPQRLNCDPVLWVTVLSTAVYAGSAAYGYQKTGACRRLAEQQWEVRAAQQAVVPHVPLVLPAPVPATPGVEPAPVVPAVPPGPEPVR